MYPAVLALSIKHLMNKKINNNQTRLYYFYDLMKLKLKSRSKFD